MSNKPNLLNEKCVHTSIWLEGTGRDASGLMADKDRYSFCPYLMCPQALKRKRRRKIKIRGHERRKGGKKAKERKRNLLHLKIYWKRG